MLPLYKDVSTDPIMKFKENQSINKYQLNDTVSLKWSEISPLLGRYPKREQSNIYLCNPGDIVLFCHPFWYCQDRNHCIQRQQHGQ